MRSQETVRCGPDYSLFSEQWYASKLLIELKLKNVHTALVKMDNIGAGGGERGGKVQIRERWRLFLKGTIVFSFPLL